MKSLSEIGAQLMRELRQALLDFLIPKGVPSSETASLIYLIRKNTRNLRASTSAGAKTLGERRDALLLGAGALYLLGYLTWALYGLMNDIGFIPVLDAQYFAAGILPAILLSIFIVAIRLTRVFDVWMKYPPTRIQLFISRGLLIIGLGAVICFSLRGNRTDILTVSELGIASACLYSSAVFARNRGIRGLQIIVVYFARANVILGLMLWLLYVKRVMPTVPPEWGGARSRCVLLDVDATQISLETADRILEKSMGISDKVRRTVSVNLIFEGNEFLFLTPQADPPSANNPVYRIRKDVVKAIFSCEK